MRTTRRLLVAAALAVAAAATLPGTPAQAIVGDAPPVDAAVSPYPYVGLLQSRVGDKTGSCTAELIEPRIAITARHCTTADGFQDSAQLVFGATRRAGGQLPDGPRYGVTDVTRNEDADVALLRLDRDVEGITPVTVPGADLGNRVQRNSVATVAGWGSVDNDDTPSLALRSAAHIVKHRWDNTALSRHMNPWPMPSLETTPGYFTPAGDYHDTGMWATHGDSGGALLVQDQGTTYLVGVFSTFHGGHGLDVDRNFFTNIAADGKYGLHDWMNRHLADLRP